MKEISVILLVNAVPSGLAVPEDAERLLPASCVSTEMEVLRVPDCNVLDMLNVCLIINYLFFFVENFSMLMLLSVFSIVNSFFLKKIRRSLELL